MKILYVILTHKGNENTRQKWQRETWLRNGTRAYCLLDDPVGEETYKNAPLKYIEFFKKHSLRGFIDGEEFDWFFFCDDDTFVYTEKLNFALKLIDDWETPTMIGFKGGEFNIYSLKIGWCSGGAGFAMNRELVKKIQNHVQNNNVIVTDETDITLAIWAAMAANVKIIDDKRFSPSRPHESPPNCITYHYCNEGDFHRLNDMK